MRVDLFDSEGNRYTVAFEGQITRDKALKLLDLIELLGGLPNRDPNSAVQQLGSAGRDLTKYDKVRSLLQRGFPAVWFTSKEVQQAYEKEFREPIGLSTISTYLARLTNKGMLLKTGSSNSLKYKVPLTTSPVTIKSSTMWRQVLPSIHMLRCEVKEHDWICKQNACWCANTETHSSFKRTTPRIKLHPNEYTTSIVIGSSCLDDTEVIQKELQNACVWGFAVYSLPEWSERASLHKFRIWARLGNGVSCTLGANWCFAFCLLQ